MRYQFHKSEETIAKRLWVKVLTNKCDGKPERTRACKDRSTNGLALVGVG